MPLTFESLAFERGITVRFEVQPGVMFCWGNARRSHYFFCCRNVKKVV